jgi:hypothetical protein
MPAAQAATRAFLAKACQQRDGEEPGDGGAQKGQQERVHIQHRQTRRGQRTAKNDDAQ